MIAEALNNTSPHTEDRTPTEPTECVFWQSEKLLTVTFIRELVSQKVIRVTKRRIN